MTYHVGETPRLLGLYSLTLVLESERDIRKSTDVSRWTTRGLFPALHLEFLGVCKEHQGKGLGSFMMMEAISTFRSMAEKAGVPILTLRPLKADLERYYADRNFIPYGQNGNMMMSAKTALAL